MSLTLAYDAKYHVNSHVNMVNVGTNVRDEELSTTLVTLNIVTNVEATTQPPRVTLTFTLTWLTWKLTMRNEE